MARSIIAWCRAKPLTLVLLATLCATSRSAARADQPTPAGDRGVTGSGTLDATARNFFTTHCYDCHGDGAQEGGLDLEQLTGEMSTRRRVEQWTRIYDRVAKGEMPPKEQPRPEADELGAVLAWIEPRLSRADRQHREVVHRRLSRWQYQNTIADLLAVKVDVTKILPEDQRAAGFDNNGEALAFSTELMEAYLEAAEAVIDAAIVEGDKPEVQTFTADSMDEVERYIPKQFSHIDGRIVIHATNETQYSKVSTRSKPLPQAGRYRFRFQAAAVHSDRPVVFSVVASDFQRVGATYKNLGYYEATSTAETFEIEADLDERFAIQFFALGLPGWVKDASDGEHPGVGFGPVEIIGPLNEQWPPESHRQLLGDLDLRSGDLSDAERVLRRFMPRAFRRQVSESEVARYVSLVRGRMAAGRSFQNSLRSGLVAVLCSPNFLYLREEAHPDRTEVNDQELASRLSYFLWGSMPDEELLRLAEKGQLRDPVVRSAQVDRMLDDAKGARFVENFVDQWLQLRDIDATTPDAKLYADFDELLKVSMVRESRSFFRTLLREDLSIDNFLDSDFAMLNARLARHYGIEGIGGLELRKTPLPADSVRGGVLTQAAVLKVTANGTNTSPVTRGVWVLENILGSPTPPPPPNIAGIEPDIRGATTIRQQLEKHRNSESCNTCHQYIDPPGFALEQFDPIGAFRNSYRHFVVNPDYVEQGWGRIEEGAAVDPSGWMADGARFENIRQFKRLLLADRASFARCLTEKLLTYGLGRELGFSDRGAVAAIASDVAAKGNGLRTLIRTIVQSDSFVAR